MRTFVTFLLTFFFAASTVWADFSYTKTTRVTGGTLLKMTRFMPGTGSIKEPQTHTIAVKGGKMVTYDKDTATIIDADAETMTQIDFKKKQYSVITFAEMKQALQAMKQQMEQMQAQMQQAQEQMPAVNLLDAVKISVNDTGQSKTISGMTTKQYILTMELSAPTGAPADLPGSKTTMDAWLTPTLPGYEEVTQFTAKMASKMAELTPGMNPMGMFRPDIAKTVDVMSQEMSKMKGISVYETLTMNGFQPSGPSVGDTVKAGAKDAAIQGALGRSRLGGLVGGLGRKKQEAPQQAEPEQPKEVTWQPVTLLEEVTELTNLSSTVDASKFGVPAGFKQVESEMKKLGARK